MDAFPEHNSKQASQAEPAIEVIGNWDEEDLLKWIQQKHSKLLNDNDRAKLKRECVDGVVFLNHAGDKKYFREDCDLAGGDKDLYAKPDWDMQTSVENFNVLVMPIILQSSATSEILIHT